MNEAISDLALERPCLTSKEATVCNRTVTYSALNDVRAITVHLGEMNGTASRQSAMAVSEAIKEMLPCDFLNSNEPVTVICLGNSSLTSDSLGPLCAKELLATRHLKSADNGLFNLLGRREISVIHAGTEGESGVASLEIARMCVHMLRPKLVITVDALRAAGIKHLCSVVQITNGITPGAGVGNPRQSINARSLGVPVISIGAPTAISLQLLVKEGIKALQNSISIAPENRQTRFFEDFQAPFSDGNYLVSASDCDTRITALAHVIAMAINRTLLGNEALTQIN